MGSPPKKSASKTTAANAKGNAKAAPKAKAAPGAKERPRSSGASAKPSVAKKATGKSRRKKTPPAPGSKGPAGLASRSKPALAKQAAENKAAKAAAARKKAKDDAAAKKPVPEFLVDGPAAAERTLILAHGAGSPMDSPFLEEIAKGVAGYGFRVVRFEFPYMKQRRDKGKKAPPDREEVLIAHWKKVVKKLGGPRGVIIGGKSLGGRIASLIVDDLGVDGLVCLGYPFHPSGTPAKTRIGHLESLRTPTLIVQGERDSFGARDEIRGYPLSWHIQIAYLTDGDHSFKPRKGAEITEQDNMDEACRLVATFCRRPNLPPAPLVL